MEKLRVFISSTMDDLKEERMAVADAINENKFWESANAESFVARTESPKEVCLEEVRNSHIYIGIFKDRYGHVPPNDNPQGYSAVALEYYEAKNKIPTLIFIDKNDSKREKKLIEFIKVIEDFNKGHWRIEYSTTDELVQSTIEAVNHEIIKSYIETTNVKQKTEIREIYELPYFKRLKETLR